MNLRPPKLKLPSLGGTTASGAPKVKVPDPLADIYYDLRERRLLPLLALIVVAIAAVPFLLGSDSEELQIPPPPAAVGGAAVGAGADLTVVEAKPGLRDYRKRLKSLTPSDPFVQKYTSVPKQSQLKSVEGGGGSGGAASGEGGSSGGSPPSSGGGSGGGGSGGGGGDGSGGGNGKAKPPRLIEFVIDIQIARSETTADGRRKMGKPKLRRKVRPLTQLPGKKAPVVTTMGINLRNGKVMFLVSDDVSRLEGDFQCVSRPPKGVCELLEIQPGFALELIYGPNDVRYRMKTVKIDAVWAGRVGDGRSSKQALEAEYGIAQSFSK